MNNIPENLDKRVQWAIDFAWKICLNKIENNELKVNKEASLQLQYANILKNTLDLIKFKPTERFDIELEKSYLIEKKQIIADIVIEYSSDLENVKQHAIELKFYKRLAFSGGKRGANDIFMFSVYKDLFYSELYIGNKDVNFCTCLILTDYENFINPKSKNTKNWTYDISHNYLSEAKKFDVSVGGKTVSFELKNRYLFYWNKIDKYWNCIVRNTSEKINL